MKLSKKVSVGSTEQYTQHYLGGIEYTGTGSTRKLEAIYFADGRVYNTNVTTTSSTVALRYEYAIRDHLGNTRLMFADLDVSGTIGLNEVLQENHYYPFGMNMEGVWMNDLGSKDNKYQYNGKELNEDFGLNWSDYGARWYDAVIGRFVSIDPISVRFPFVSTYNNAENEPIGNIDLHGLQKVSFTLLGKIDYENKTRNFLTVISYNHGAYNGVIGNKELRASIIMDGFGAITVTHSGNGVKMFEGFGYNKQAIIKEIDLPEGYIPSVKKHDMIMNNIVKPIFSAKNLEEAMKAPGEDNWYNPLVRNVLQTLIELKSSKEFETIIGLEGDLFGSLFNKKGYHLQTYKLLRRKIEFGNEFFNFEGRLLISATNIYLDDRSRNASGSDDFQDAKKMNEEARKRHDERQKQKRN